MSIEEEGSGMIPAAARALSRVNALSIAPDRGGSLALKAPLGLSRSSRPSALGYSDFSGTPACSPLLDLTRLRQLFN